MFGVKRAAPEPAGGHAKHARGERTALARVERVGRIELPATAWKAVVLPLYDTRLVGAVGPPNLAGPA